MTKIIKSKTIKKCISVFLSMLMLLSALIAGLAVTAYAVAPTPAATEYSGETVISANCVEILVESGTTAGYSNIRYDSNRDGVIDTDDSWVQVGSEAPTAAGYDLSGAYIIGGKIGDTDYADAKVVIDGASVGTIYGGCIDGAFEGNVSIVVKNGADIGNVCGGSGDMLTDGSSVTGDVNIEVKDSSVDKIYGYVSDTTVDGNISIALQNTNTLMVTGNLSGFDKDTYEATLTIAGNMAMDKNQRGIILNSFTSKITIASSISTSENGAIVLFAPVNYALNKIAASAIYSDDAIAEKFTLNNAPGLKLIKSGANIKTAAKSFAVTQTLTDLTATAGTSGADKATYKTNYSTTLAASGLDALPSAIAVTVGGDAIADSNYTYDSTTGLVTIKGEAIIGDIVITASAVKHVHSYATTWTFDATDHWKVCTTDGCDGITEKAAHVTEVRNASPASCSATGYTGDTYCSVCNKLIASGTVIDKLAHTPDLRDYDPATCEHDGYTGDLYCSECDTLIAEGTVIPKTECKDKNNDGICDDCGKELECIHTDKDNDGKCDKCGIDMGCNCCEKHHHDLNTWDGRICCFFCKIFTFVSKLYSSVFYVFIEPAA